MTSPDLQCTGQHSGAVPRITETPSDKLGAQQALAAFRKGDASPQSPLVSTIAAIRHYLLLALGIDRHSVDADVRARRHEADAGLRWANAREAIRREYNLRNVDDEDKWCRAHLGCGYDAMQCRVQLSKRWSEYEAKRRIEGNNVRWGLEYALSLIAVNRERAMNSRAAPIRKKALTYGAPGNIADVESPYLGRGEQPPSLYNANSLIDVTAAENAVLRQRLLKSRYGKIGRGNQESGTPLWLYAHFDSEFHFTRDLAASAMNHKHPNYYTKEQNALEQEWEGVCWLNPPWSQLESFMRKAYEAAQRGATVVCLVPLWACENWFLQYAVHGHIRILSDRVAFVGYQQKAPQPLCVVVFTRGSQRTADGRLHVSIEHIQAPEEPRLKGRTATVMSRGFATL